MTTTTKADDSLTENLYFQAKNLLSEIEDILSDIDINLILNYVRYIVAGLLMSISIVIVLDIFRF